MRKLTEEWKKHISEALSKYWKTPAAEAHRKKLSEAKKRWWREE